MKPILFSTPMVQAILDGRKTQTRRVIKPQPPSGAHFIDLSDEMTIINIDRNGFECPKDVDGLYATFEYDGYPECPVFKSPYSVGNVLWVRETWKPQDYFFVDDIMSCQIIFKAGGPDNLNPRVFWNHGDDTIFESCGTWHPSIHMPRSAARLFLKVTDVRAERLNQITNNDILREGLRSESCNICVHDGGSGCEHCFSILNPFRKLWDSLNAKRGYGWDTNPWVWVCTFEKTEKPEVEG